MSSGTINLGRAVRDFTQSDELAEYTNVEFQIDNEHSVYAKYFGSLIPDDAETFYKVYGEGQAIIVSDKNDIYFETNRATTYGMGAFSNPAVARYRELEGRTVHFEADVIIGSNTTGNVVINAYFRNEKDTKSNQAVEIKRIGLYSTNTHVSFDFVVGDWIETRSIYSYLCFSILISSEGAGAFSVDNIRYYAKEAENENTLVAKCPFATSSMALRVLESLNGFHYKPFEATGARLDMKAEFGDTVVIDGSSYGLYAQDINFGSESVSTISAPADQELEHEFPYVPSTERNFRREVATLRAEIDIRSGEIEAKVEERVPSNYGNPNTFGWTLQSDNFTVYSNGQSVLKVTSGGAEITGRVVATEGVIGGCEIVDGKLTIQSANIGSISAKQITADYLDVARIMPHSLGQDQLGENSVSNWQLAGNAVQGYNITSGAVDTPQLASLAVKTGNIDGGAVTMSKMSSDVRGVIGSAARLFGNSVGNGYSFPTLTNPVFYSQIRWSAPSVGGGGRSYILGLYNTKPSAGKYVIAIPA